MMSMADWLLKEWEERGKEIADLRAQLEQAQFIAAYLEGENAKLREELQELKYELKEERN